MIAIVILCFFLNILPTAVNLQEPTFCEKRGMELIVTVKSAHYRQPIGNCFDPHCQTDPCKSEAGRLERENKCINDDKHEGLKVEVTPGSAEAKNTTEIPPWVDSSNGVFRYDAYWTDDPNDPNNFVEYKGNTYSGKLRWPGISEANLDNIVFKFYNDRNFRVGDTYPLDVRPYKSLDENGKIVVLKWTIMEGPNPEWVQITAEVVVVCTLDDCDTGRDPIINDCSSVLDESKCYSLTYSLSTAEDGSGGQTLCRSECPPEIFQNDPITGNCVLKKCLERTFHEYYKCGSSDCYPSPTNAADNKCYTSCPPFFSRGGGVCVAEECSKRDPISGVCSWDAGTAGSEGCGYLRNEILCKPCAEKHFTAIDGVCILKQCTDRKIIDDETHQYACGDGSCLGQPDRETCGATCPSINYIPDSRGQCRLKDCCLRTPMIKRSGLPCDSNDCFLQPFKDFCADDCPSGYTKNTDTGVCVSEECANYKPTTVGQSSDHGIRSQIHMSTDSSFHVNSSPVTYSNTHISSGPVTYPSTEANNTHMTTLFRGSRTLSNEPHTYAGPGFCDGFAVEITIGLVHLDNNVMNTVIGVKIGSEEEKKTGPFNRGTNWDVFWDADFSDVNNVGTTRVLTWNTVNPEDLGDVVFQIYNEDTDMEKYQRAPLHVDLNTYKQVGENLNDLSAALTANIVALNKTGYQIMIFSEVKVACSLKDCLDRTPIDGSCSSSLDGLDTCLTLIEAGKSGCRPRSACPGVHYWQIDSSLQCVLKPCSLRKVNNTRDDGYVCGSEGCEQKPTTKNCDVEECECDIEICPVFYERNPEGGCTLLPCEKRNPHDGNCQSIDDGANETCGYLRDGPKCVVCDEHHLPGYSFSEGVCCAQDHYGPQVDSNGRCDLKPCAARHLNTSTPYLCGSHDCQYQPETNTCVPNCATNTARDARGFCGPAPVESCPIPRTTPPDDSPYPCREATCYYLQPDGSCGPTCPTGYRPDFMGVCLDDECTKRTYNPREENWPCGWPEENCFQDIGPDAADPLQGEYTKCISSPDRDRTGCTDPFFETNTTEALRTGKCTRMPCEDRRPQEVSATEYTCGDHCVYVPPRVVDKEDEDYDPNDIGRCVDEPPAPPPSQAKAPKTVKDYWWVFLLIALLIVAAVSVILFILLWRLKKYHDAQVEYDRDLMMRTAEDREKMKTDRKEGVKEDLLNPESEGGLIFGSDGDEPRDTWMKNECSDEYVVDAVRCAPPFDIVHCDRRRTLFALYTELSANALSARGGDAAAAFRKLLPEKLQEPLNPSMALALVLRHLHQEYTNGVGNVTPHSLLVSTKGSLALVVTRDGLANQAHVDGAFENARWYAPEQKFDANATHATDIYSLGLVMWQVASAMHEIPLAEVDSQSAFTRMAGSYRPSLRDIHDVSGTYDIRAFTQVIESCWVPDSAERPTAAQVVDSLSALTSAPAGPSGGW